MEWVWRHIVMDWLHGGLQKIAATLRGETTISSPKHPDQLQHPASLQINEYHSFSTGSNVTKAVLPLTSV
jgi:hypothetical protein